MYSIKLGPKKIGRLGVKLNLFNTSSVELRGGSAAGEGNVFVDGLGVCDDLWEQVDAQVLCRFLTTVLLLKYLLLVLHF